MKKLSILLVLVLVASAAFVASAQGPSKAQELSAAGITNWTPGQGQGSGPTISKLENPIQIPQTKTGPPGTVTYDSGAVTALPTIFGQIYGNRFAVDNAGNALKATVTLNSFSFFFAEDSTADTGLFFQPAVATTVAGMLNPRTSITIDGLVNAGSSFTNLATINVINQTALDTTGVFPGSFYLGAWCANVNTTVPVDNEAIALDTVAGAAGFNGYTAVSGGSGAAMVFAPQGSWNAVLRANITGIVPVELMAFDVE